MDTWRRTVLEAGRDGSAFLSMTHGELSALAIVNRDKREQHILDLAGQSMMVRRAIWSQEKHLSAFMLAGFTPRVVDQSADEWEAMLAKQDADG